MSIDNKINRGRSLGLKIGAGIFTGLFAYGSLIGCKAQPITQQEIVETKPVVETQIETSVETETITETVVETPQKSYFDKENIDKVLRFEVEDGMFPSYWLTDKIDPKAESLNPEEIKRSKEVMIKSMKKYPENILFDDLKRTYVLDLISFFGINYGGANASEGYIYSKLW